MAMSRLLAAIVVLASIIIAPQHLTGVAAAGAAADAKCLTQKMLISCVAGASDAGVVACGGGGGGGGAVPSSATTEILLEWNYNISTTIATLRLELSKPANDLSLVLLDLKGTELCTVESSSVRMTITYQASPRPKLAVRGLSISSVKVLTMEGNLAINSELLSGLPNLVQLLAVKNNVTISSEPLARYSVSGAPALNSVRIEGSVHSVAYSAPLVESLATLLSLHVVHGNMILLKSGAFSGLPALRYLYLSNNNILELEPGSLSGLTGLEQLHLNFNGLKRLTNYAFVDLTSLKRLNLARNRLTELEPNALNGLRSLESLDLSDNQLTRLPVLLFAQQVALQTLSLQQNKNLRPEDSENDTFCPLEGLKILSIDRQIECLRFGTQQFEQLVQLVNRNKKYICDIGVLRADQQPCFNWVERLAARQRESGGSVEGMSAVGKQQGPTQLNIILLIIFGVICFIHVITTVVTICVCRHMRQRRRASHGLVPQRKSPSVSSPEEERSLDASPGVTSGKESASVLATRFHSSGNGGASSKKEKEKDKDGAANRLNVRDKSYDFNEDETPRA